MKRRLREQVLLQRKALTESEVLEKSSKVRRLLFASSWYQAAQTILFYVSYDNEVSTHEMIQDSLKMGKQVVVPKTDTKKKTMLCSLLTKWDDLIPGAYNILEPRQECIKEVNLESIDLMIIPGVVFDYQGNRIGHGMGYYDRLLKNKNTASLVGLAFELQIVERIPAEKHDMRVEKIITEQRIIDCR